MMCWPGAGGFAGGRVGMGRVYVLGPMGALRRR